MAALVSNVSYHNGCLPEYLRKAAELDDRHTALQFGF